MWDNDPLITTVIPTFRRPALLRRAIWSVANQDLECVRICVYDNASGDETRSVVERLAAGDPRIEYWCHEKNLGPVPNFNFGLSRVATPYFSVLSDDDMLMPGFYSMALKSLENNPDAGFYAGRAIVYNADQDVVHYSEAAWPEGSEGRHEYSLPSVLKMIAKPYTWTGIAWRREVIDAVGLLDAFGSDDNYVVRAAIHYPFILTREATGLTLHHSERFSSDPVHSGGTQTRDAHGAYLDFLVGRSFQLQADIQRAKHCSRSDKMRAAAAVSDRLRNELITWLPLHAIPNDRPEEIRTVRTVQEAIGSPLWSRLLVRTVQRVFDHHRTTAKLASCSLRLARELAIERRRRRCRHDPADAVVRHLIAQAGE
jgi:glycosyltransferase involved in cell wall biosynthesis